MKRAVREALDRERKERHKRTEERFRQADAAVAENIREAMEKRAALDIQIQRFMEQRIALLWTRP